jgi:hypothetical protein
MVFSLVLAFIVTPWASVRLLRWGKKPSRPRPPRRSALRASRRPLHAPLPPHHGPAHRERRVAAGPSSAASWLLLVAAMALVPLGWVKVKMLPFDNKSEFQIILNMPEGSALERTARSRARSPPRCSRRTEVTTTSIYVGTASPFNFNGLVRHYFMRRGAERGRHPGEPRAEARRARRRATTSPSASARRGGHRGEVTGRASPGGRSAARPAGAADAGGRDLRTRRRARQALAPSADDLREDTRRRRHRLVRRGRPAQDALRHRQGEGGASTASAPKRGRRRAHRRRRRGPWMLHVPREKEDVNIVLRTAARRATPRGIARVRRRRRNALPPGRHRQATAVPLRELVTVERPSRTRASITRTCMPVTYVIGDVAGVNESPVYAIQR